VFPASDDVSRPAVPVGLTLAPIVRRAGGLLLDQFIGLRYLPRVKVREVQRQQEVQKLRCAALL